MIPNPQNWKPIAIDQIQPLCGTFEDWVLCGGLSIPLITGEDRRSHGDTDIGVYRSQVSQCLHAIGRESVFLASNKELIPWDGTTIPKEVHDIWISNLGKTAWIMQVMVYDDEEDRVIYRRNTSISWRKESHFVVKDGIKILNPFITFLFKSNKQELEAKEMDDLIHLIEKGAEQVDTTRVSARRNPNTPDTLNLNPL